ncbi:MAG: hypothetical protein U0232_04250 [Thermomicrobiales bacterium]
MADETREMALSCPRCGKPINWSIARLLNVQQPEMMGDACQCRLSDADWGDLSQAAIDAVEQPAGHTLMSLRPRRQLHEAGDKTNIHGA